MRQAPLSYPPLGRRPRDFCVKNVACDLGAPGGEGWISACGRGDYTAAEATPGHPLGFFSPLLNVKATKAVKGVSVEQRALTNENCSKERSANNRDLGPVLFHFGGSYLGESV